MARAGERRLGSSRRRWIRTWSRARVCVVDRACAKPEDALNDARDAVGRVARSVKAPLLLPRKSNNDEKLDVSAHSHARAARALLASRPASPRVPRSIAQPPRRPHPRVPRHFIHAEGHLRRRPNPGLRVRRQVVSRRDRHTGVVGGHREHPASGAQAQRGRRVPRHRPGPVQGQARRGRRGGAPPRRLRSRLAQRQGRGSSSAPSISARRGPRRWASWVSAWAERSPSSPRSTPTTLRARRPSAPRTRPSCQTDKITKPVQAHFGELDNLAGFSDPDAAKKLLANLRAAGSDCELHMYPNVGRTRS